MAKQNALLYGTGILIILNLLIIGLYDLQVSRAARLFSVIIFSVYYLSVNKPKNLKISLVFIFFIIREIFFQFYETSFGFKIYLLFAFCAYLTLIIDRLPKMNSLRINRGVILVTIVLIIANSYTLLTLMDLLSYSFRDSFEIGLFYLYGAMMIIMGVAAVHYNNKYNSTRSLHFLYFVFAFIITDIASLFAYYFGFEMFYFISRLFFLIALGLLSDYGLNKASAQEENHQYDMINSET
ncbi:MAG: hypothetical protein V7767_01335 [Leeuwenhoekiella sp.]